MRHLYLLLLVALITASSTTLNAQLEEGGWAPPFRMTDIEGNEYRLYDYVAEGKAVIIYLSATWCYPCWEQHQSGVLHEVWETYGPNGTDEIMIFFIEADPNTGYEQLVGLEGPSQGNWVNGTPYPIIDASDWQLANAYDLNFFPTVTLVCPDMRVKVPNMWSNVANWTVDYVVNTALSCEGTTPLVNDVAIHSYDIYGTDCYTGQLDYQLFNGGSETMTDATINLLKDGEIMDTYAWSGELTYGEEVTLSFEEIDLEEGNNEFTIALAGSDTDDSNDQIDLPFEKAFTTVKDITVYATMDENAEDDNTRWWIENEAGEVVAESEPFTNYEYAETTVSLSEDGCYNFLVSDDGEDGIGEGGFILASDDSGVLIYDGGAFGSMDETLFFASGSVNATSATDRIFRLTAQPNPTHSTTMLELELEATTTLQIECLNATGQVVQRLNPGTLFSGFHQIPLDLGAYPAGLYFVRAVGVDVAATLRVNKI